MQVKSARTSAIISYQAYQKKKKIHYYSRAQTSEKRLNSLMKGNVVFENGIQEKNLFLWSSARNKPPRRWKMSIIAS